MPQEEYYLKKELYDLIQKDSSIFEFLQSGSLDGVWFWDLEKPENEWMSQRFWTNFGYDPAEKKNLSTEWQSMIFEEDLKTATDNFVKHCANPNYPYDQIVRYRKKDGSTSWVRCRGIAIRDKNGKPLRMLGAHNDITAIKEVELEIEKEKNKFKKLVSNVPGMIYQFIKKPDGSFSIPFATESIKKMFGCSLEEVKNDFSPILKTILPEDLERFIQSIEYSAEHLTTWEYEYRVQISKKIKWYLGNSTPEKLDDGSIMWHGFTTDITSKKEAEQDIKNKIEELEKFNAITLNRELKMVELKNEIQDLKAKLKNK